MNSELIPGGLSQNMSLQQIAAKHQVSIAFIKQQIIKGIGIESEHTTDKKIAAEIARDHLVEDPKYYIKLATIEMKESKTRIIKLKPLLSEGDHRPEPAIFKQLLDTNAFRDNHITIGTDSSLINFQYWEVSLIVHGKREGYVPEPDLEGIIEDITRDLPRGWTITLISDPLEYDKQIAHNSEPNKINEAIFKVKLEQK